MSVVQQIVAARQEQDNVFAEIMNHRPDTEDFILNEWIRTEFTLPTSITARLIIYQLRVWEGAYIVSQVKDGKLARPGSEVAFDVHWATTPAIVKTLEKVACSFRMTVTGKRYVVIKKWEEKNSQGDWK